MKIGTRQIFINRNKNIIKDDILKLTEKSGIEDSFSELKIFRGKIDGDYFKLTPNILFTSKLPIPELQGELIRKNDETQINFYIIAPFLFIVIDILYTIFIIYMIITNITPSWPIKNIFLNFLIIILMFFLPIFHCIYYFYNLKELIENFQLCVEGYYHKYLKNREEPNGI